MNLLFSQKASIDSTAQELTQAMQQPQQVLANQMQPQPQSQSNQVGTLPEIGLDYELWILDESATK